MKRLLMTGLVFAGLQAAAAIGYQGRIVRADGARAQSAIPMAMTFRLYDSVAPEKVLWGRTIPVRVEPDGSFYVELRDDLGTAVNAPDASTELAFALSRVAGDALIGLTPPGSKEMVPRQRLTSYSRAARAERAKSVGKVELVKGGTVLASTLETRTMTVSNLTVSASVEDNGTWQVKPREAPETLGGGKRTVRVCGGFRDVAPQAAPKGMRDGRYGSSYTAPCDMLATLVDEEAQTAYNVVLPKDAKLVFADKPTPVVSVTPFGQVDEK